MSVEIKGIGGLSETQIAAFEQEYSVKLPSSYRKFMMEFNGGTCVPNHFFWEDDYYEAGVADSYVELFSPISHGEHDYKYSLQSQFKTYKIDEKRVPDNCIPIADLVCGDLLLISTTGIDEGFVYFWDHGNEIDFINNNSEEIGDMFLVNKDFSSFLASLVSFEDYEKRFNGEV